MNDDGKTDVYRRGSLSGFTFGERLLIRLADVCFFCLIGLIGSSLRFSISGSKEGAAALNSGRLILAIWHDRIFAGTYFLRNRKLIVLTSQSFDGEYIARFLTRFGFGAIRGSSTRGGVRGLVEMIRLMRQGAPMAFTADGPKGPCYNAKSGPVMLAKKTGEPIIPFIVECRNYFTVNSWDRLQIPLPFSKARVFIGDPIYIEPDDENIEAGRIRLQNALDDLVEKGNAWRTIARPDLRQH